MLANGSWKKLPPMQIRTHFEGDIEYECNIPDADVSLMPGVKWGEVGRPFTPAFWRYFCIVTGATEKPEAYHIGNSLREEVVACLLGGHGILGEVGVAAYSHLRALNLIDKECITAGELEEALLMPLEVNGRIVRYRYPYQKARFIAQALTILNSSEPPRGNNLETRDWLTRLPGIGMKTASWIVRNWMDADDIAIIDIHIHRAGVIAGIFKANENVALQYPSMEERFVRFANQIGIRANILDNQIWNELRTTPLIVRRLLEERGVKQTDHCGLPVVRKRRVPQTIDLFAHA